MAETVRTAIGLLELVACGVALPCVLRIRGSVAFALAVLLSMAATVVLVSLALSQFHLLTPAGILAAQLALAACLGFAWSLRGSVPPRPRLSARRAAMAAKSHP